MKIYFVNLTIDADAGKHNNNAHPRHKLPPLDVGYCMAIAAEKGHEVEFVDTWVESVSLEALSRKIADQDPLLVVIKPNIMTFSLTRELAERIKKEGDRKIIVMGPVISASPSAFINENSLIDAAIIGEPENTFSELLERSKNSKDINGIAGLRYHAAGGDAEEMPRELIADLDALPFPRHDMFLSKGYSFLYPIKLAKKMKFATMLTTRGCPNKCRHCSPIVRTSYGSKYRQRSINNTIEEIKYLQNMGVNVIYFSDDNFTVNKQRVTDLCDQMITHGLDIVWAIQSRAETLDFALLQKMQQAGCRCINIGIESVQPEILRQFNKCIDLKQLEELIAFARELNVNINADFIVGTPWETEEDIKATLSFAKRMNFSLVTVLSYMTYPGSLLYEESRVVPDLERDSLYLVRSGKDGTSEVERKRRYFYKQYYFRAAYFITFIRNMLSVSNLSAQAGLVFNFCKYILRCS